MNRNKRRILEGKVISDKNTKTITVLVNRYKNHPIYKKRVLISKKYLVHDEYEKAKIGDRVAIMECRPLSAQKRFRLEKIIAKANDQDLRSSANASNLEVAENNS